MRAGDGSAAITASVPEFEKRTSSAAGTIFATARPRRITLRGEGEDPADPRWPRGRRIDPRVGVAEDAGP